MDFKQLFIIPDRKKCNSYLVTDFCLIIIETLASLFYLLFDILDFYLPLGLIWIIGDWLMLLGAYFAITGIWNKIRTKLKIAGVIYIVGLLLAIFNFIFGFFGIYLFRTLQILFAAFLIFILFMQSRSENKIENEENEKKEDELYTV